MSNDSAEAYAEKIIALARAKRKYKKDGKAKTKPVKDKIEISNVEAGPLARRRSCLRRPLRHLSVPRST
jgi:hypothetical protein